MPNAASRPVRSTVRVSSRFVPPRQYVGATAFRKDWEGLLAAYPASIHAEVSDWKTETDGSLAYGHGIFRTSGPEKAGRPLDLTVRVADVYKQVSGKWLVIHEHVSFPVDVETGKADLSSKLVAKQKPRSVWREPVIGRLVQIIARRYLASEAAVPEYIRQTPLLVFPIPYCKMDSVWNPIAETQTVFPWRGLSTTKFWIVGVQAKLVSEKRST